MVEPPADPGAAERALPPPPDYAAAAPSDWMGARAIEVMLADVEFPTTTRDLLARTARWRVPVRGPDVTVAIGDLLAGVDLDERFRSPEDVARAVRRRHHGY